GVTGDRVVAEAAMDGVVAGVGMRALGTVGDGRVVGRGVAAVGRRAHGVAGQKVVALAATDLVAACDHFQVNQANRYTRRGGQIVSRRSAVAVGGQGVTGDDV